MIDIIVKIIASLFEKTKPRKKKILKVKPIYQIDSAIPEIEKWGCNLATMAMIINCMVDHAPIHLEGYYLDFIDSKAMSKKCYISSYKKCLDLFLDDAKYKMDTKKNIVPLLDDGYPIKCRMRTGKSTYHFSLIIGYKITKDGLLFIVNDPMKRDFYADKNLNFLDKKKVKTGRKVDRLDYVV